jgi:hypothetical protein
VAYGDLRCALVVVTGLWGLRNPLRQIYPICVPPLPRATLGFTILGEEEVALPVCLQCAHITTLDFSVMFARGCI